MDRTDGFDPDDRNADDGVSEQLSASDLLLDRGVADLLDEGYSPPDRPSRVRVPTVSEEIRGSSLADLLAAEVAEVGGADDRGADGWTASERIRSGRLVSPDDDGYLDITDDIAATDVGIDGAAASAEEAAMHIIELGENDQTGRGWDEDRDEDRDDTEGEGGDR